METGKRNEIALELLKMAFVDGRTDAEQAKKQIETVLAAFDRCRNHL